jgi:hypothetical protein
MELGFHSDKDLDRTILRKGKSMSKINSRKLGRSGIEISPMGLGCWAIGGPFWAGETPLGWGEVDDEESIRAIHAALDLGITLFDTANVYGAGHSERVLGWREPLPEFAHGWSSPPSSTPFSTKPLVR